MTTPFGGVFCFIKGIIVDYHYIGYWFLSLCIFMCLFGNWVANKFGTSAFICFVLFPGFIIWVIFHLFIRI